MIDMKGDELISRTNHFAKLIIEGENAQANWKFRCEAEVGADCRLYCTEGRESWPCDHEVIDSGDCNFLTWADNDGAVLDKEFVAFDGPIDVYWNNDFYEFTPLPVVSSPVTLTRETLDELRYQVAQKHFASDKALEPVPSWEAMGQLIDAILDSPAPVPLDRPNEEGR